VATQVVTDYHLFLETAFYRKCSMSSA